MHAIDSRNAHVHAPQRLLSPNRRFNMSMPMLTPLYHRVRRVFEGPFNLITKFSAKRQSKPRPADREISQPQFARAPRHMRHEVHNRLISYRGSATMGLAGVHAPYLLFNWYSVYQFRPIRAGAVSTVCQRLAMLTGLLEGVVLVTQYGQLFPSATPLLVTRDSHLRRRTRSDSRQQWGSRTTAR